jgi:hypothetical protein
MLIIERPGVWMLRDTQVWPRSTAVFVADVPFTDVASQHEDLLGGLESSGLAVPHGDLLQQSADVQLPLKVSGSSLQGATG